MLGELEIVAAGHLGARIENGVDAGAAGSWLRLGTPAARRRSGGAERQRAARGPACLPLPPAAVVLGGSGGRPPDAARRSAGQMRSCPRPRGFRLKPAALSIDRRTKCFSRRSTGLSETHNSLRAAWDRACDRRRVGRRAVLRRASDVQRGELVDRAARGMAWVRSSPSWRRSRPPQRMYARSCVTTSATTSAVVLRGSCPRVPGLPRHRRPAGSRHPFVRRPARTLHVAACLGRCSTGVDRCRSPQRLDDRTSAPKRARVRRLHARLSRIPEDWCRLSDEKSSATATPGGSVCTAAYFASGCALSSDFRHCRVPHLPYAVPGPQRENRPRRARRRCPANFGSLVLT